MDKRGRAKFTFTPTDKNLLILQNTGFINKRGRTRGRLNLNDFLNLAVAEKVGINDSSQNGELLEKILLSEIQLIQAKRDRDHQKAENRLRELAQRLTEVRGQKKVVDYEG